MNKSQRIYFNSNQGETDKYIKVRLEQETDSLEFLSMRIDTKDVYRDFNADYGVLVGRVTANGGVGIQNARISIFIPLAEEDYDNGDIKSIYPYKTPRDKNKEGKRYNLLPRVSRINPANGEIKPKQPFGSFPTKEEVITNSEFLDVYKKYYKYTALTNDAGDYMIFGVPIGVQTVHLSVDITDIGKYSMTPAAMVTNLGYSPNLFTDNNSKIKPSSDLNDLPNIETQEISVNIVPFWGDAETFEIGITRQDFRIRSVLKNTFIIFGSVFTDGSTSMWGSYREYGGNDDKNLIRQLYAAKPDGNATNGMYSKRIGIITEKIYYYLPNVTDEEIPNADPTDPNVMRILDSSEYSSYKRDGDFVFIISCNRDKVITNEFGIDVPLSNTSSDGVFTKFKGFITIEITPDELPMDFTANLGDDKTNVVPFRYKLKFPQYASKGNSFNSTDDNKSAVWRKQHFTFEAGKLYSVSRFHGVTQNTHHDDDTQNTTDYFFNYNTINNVWYSDTLFNVGIIVNNDDVGGDEIRPNSIYQFPSNFYQDPRYKHFGGNWMNFSVHLPQVGFMQNGYAYVHFVRNTDNFSYQNGRSSPGGSNEFYYYNNSQPIAAGDTNTKFMARSDLHWTDFIEVPKEDVKKINDISEKGFKESELAVGLSGKYRNGEYQPAGWSAPCPVNGGRLQGDINNAPDSETYFYKGFDTANCFEFLTNLGIN